jgi:uncharacterized tellurite resistance protein B-like protein
MAAEKLQTNLLETLKSDIGVADIGGSEQIFLTPYLALACGLLYMMASDGALEAEESSQLQAVLGGDEAVLSYALRYVQTVPVDQFFLSASELLSVKDKWCILTNVCDALLSDGHADRAELTLFAQMIKAFGLRTEQFEPYFKILSLKNDKSVLGRYAGVKEERQPMTPHFALAIALLYMLTADGSIGVQEVGQLEAVIGEFDGLQNVALKYVRSVKLKQFLDEAAALLKPEQKIYILTNVCDSMLSDGEVAHLEDKVFLSMLTAFGFTEKAFARYLKVLETKNFKPFDTSAFKNRVTHDRVSGRDDADGVVFKNELADAASQSALPKGADDTAMSQFIARTMQENIQSVSDDFGSQSNVVKVGLNATDGLNRQGLGESDSNPKNQQRIDDVEQVENLQKVQASTQDANRQAIDFDSAARNQQLVAVNVNGANRQTMDADAVGLHREALDPEVRAQNIHEVVGVVNLRLDRFEVDHHRFLQIGRAQKFTDDFVLVEEDASSVNRQLVDASFVRMGIEFSSETLFADADDMDGKAGLSKMGEVSKVNVGNVPAVIQAAEWHGVESQNANRLGDSHFFNGTARLTARYRKFAYVQFFVATVALVFAAPISTKTTFGRAFAGPLITESAPVSELEERQSVLTPESSATQ